MAVHKSNIPKEELETIARCFLPDIVAFFETDEGKREYEEWKQKKEKEEQTEKKSIA